MKLDTPTGLAYHHATHNQEEPMGTYIMLSTITNEGRKVIKHQPSRIKAVNKEMESFGAKVISQYAVLGEYDFVTIIEAPDNETIARVSVEFGSRGTIRLTTLTAIGIDEYIETVEHDMPGG